MLWRFNLHLVRTSGAVPSSPLRVAGDPGDGRLLAPCEALEMHPDDALDPRLDRECPQQPLWRQGGQRRPLGGAVVAARKDVGWGTGGAALVDHGDGSTIKKKQHIRN